MSQPDASTSTAAWIRQVGTITTCEHGHTLVKGWTIDLRRRPDTTLSLMDELVLVHPEQVLLAPLPRRCPSCFRIASD